jgi:hypothetical protein
VTDAEKQGLDAWLAWAGGEVNSWTGKDGVTHYEARARKEGTPLRRIENDRYAAIATLKIAYLLNDKAVKETKARCTSCPQDAVETFKVRVYKGAAMFAGITLTGPVVDYCPINGDSIHEETVPLCARCMAEALGRFLDLTTPAAVWLKIVRAGP